MRATSVLLLVLLLASAASAASGWRRLPRPAERDATNPPMALLFAIEVPRISELAGILHSRGDPEHTDFRKWMTREEIAAYTTAPAVTDDVARILRGQGAVSVEPVHGGAYVRAIMPMRTVEAVFGVELSLYEHDATGRMLWRADEHLVPAILRSKVTHVLGLADFPSDLRRVACPYGSETCPAALADAYGISPTVPAHPGRVVIYNDVSSGEAYNAADFASFLSVYAPSTTVTVTTVGPNTGANSCGGAGFNCAEAALDVQTASAVLGNGTVLMYMSTNTVGVDSLLDFFAYLQTLPDPAGIVASISYGGDERENSPQYMISLYYEAMKAVAMGISIVAASGDQGVQGFLEACTQFSAIMPANIPFVVAAGGTAGVESGTAETTCSTAIDARITSGGGFSEMFGQPPYQSADVEAYLAKDGMPPAGYFNENGRAYPDVSAAARTYPIIVGSQRVYVDGTSASTPVIAAMLARVNAELRANNESTLGYVHPFLYSLPSQCFRDITTGDNRCGDASQMCCSSGFPARTGWDAATGLGAMLYPCVRSYALSENYTAPIPVTAPTYAAASPMTWMLSDLIGGA